MEENSKNLQPQNRDHLTQDELKEVVRRLKVALPVIGGVIAILVLAIAAFFIFAEQDIPGDGTVLSPNVEFQQELSPTPLPFQEMTIPYLRELTFESALGEREQVSSNANYTSYLTSYDSDGLKINGLLTIPRGDAPTGGFPAIVFVHGYIPPANYQTLTSYSAYVDYLARNGFVVFKIDLRGHANSEGEAGGGYYSSDYVIDVLNAQAALAASDFVNPARIGFWGHSMAGNVVGRAMAASPDTRATSIWAGAVYTYSDFAEYGIDDNSYRPPSEQSESRRLRNELFETYGQFDPNSEFWKQVPMTNYLDGISGAVQLNHAVNDDVVDIGFSRNFASILEGSDIVYELNEYPSGGHNITGAAFNSAMQNTVRFFREHL